jgi:hypothetical protein
MELLMEVATIFSGLNIVVLLALLYIFGRVAVRSRAPLSAALVGVASMLMTQNVLSLYAFYTMEPLFGLETMPFLSAISVLQFAAYVLLLRFTI